jgi:hypothetical protein
MIVMEIFWSRYDIGYFENIFLNIPESRKNDLSFHPQNFFYPGRVSTHWRYRISVSAVRLSASNSDYGDVIYQL